MCYHCYYFFFIKILTSLWKKGGYYNCGRLWQIFIITNKGILCLRMDYRPSSCVKDENCNLDIFQIASCNIKSIVKFINWKLLMSCQFSDGFARKFMICDSVDVLSILSGFARDIVFCDLVDSLSILSGFARDFSLWFDGLSTK